MSASESVLFERTTNERESFHATFKKNFNHSHSKIYNLAEATKKVPTDAYIVIRSSEKPSASYKKYISGLKKRFDKA